MLSGLRHSHNQTKSISSKEQKAFIRIVDRFAYLSVLVPLLTIPQFVTIFVHHDASNISFITWLTYLVSACYWTYYGWLHKAPPIWFPNILMVIVDIGVLVGVWLYG